MTSSRRAVRVGALTAILAAGLTIPTGAQAQEEPFDVVASGLDNPRHLTFSPNGTLYVVEAGAGGPRPGNCVDHPDLGNFCLGFTGAVTRVRDNGADPQVLTGLPSIANPTEALGPSDIVFTGQNRFVLSIGLGGSDEFRDGFGPAGAGLATLVTGSLKRDRFTELADVMADSELANNPDGTDIDSNPVGLVRKGNNYVLADAGANAVVQLSKKGVFTTVAALPQGSALAPPFLGLPPGTQIPTDAVPTSVVRGPDGAFYISQLTGFPFEKGDANIWRVVPGQAATVWASGLTNVTDLAFARNGDLYAVQISAEGLLTGPIGSLVKVTPGGSQHETIAGGLEAPYGVALKGNSTAYVTTGATSFGGGEVIRIPLD